MGRSIHFSNSTLRRVCFCSLSLTGANLHQCHVSPISHAQWSAKGERNESGKCDGKASCLWEWKIQEKKNWEPYGHEFFPPMDGGKEKSVENVRENWREKERMKTAFSFFLFSYFSHTFFTSRRARSNIILLNAFHALFSCAWCDITDEQSSIALPDNDFPSRMNSWVVCEKKRRSKIERLEKNRQMRHMNDTRDEL